MDQQHLLAVTRAILSQPTAPFHEDAVRGGITMQLAQLPHVSLEQDEFGNVLARYHRGRGEPHFAFVAHMDHPGFVGSEFLGNVPKAYRAKNPPIRDFGAFAMWDLPPFEVRNGRIFSRACDDLIGCATIVAMFHELERTESEASVVGVFTRAEEVGFIGAIHLAKSGLLPRELTVVSIETSSERGGACKMEAGVIIRVGDKTSIFDAAATAQLTELATAASIPHQRALMAGGTCEATAFQLYGYRSAALCIALGNYHNCGADERIESEFVSIDDLETMVRLCVVAASARDLVDPEAVLRGKLEQRLATYARYFDGL